MSINTIFFDLDGTLIDTIEDILYAINSVLVPNNHKKLTKKIKPYVSKGIITILNKKLTNVDKENINLYHKKILNIYKLNISKHSKYFDGMEFVIKTIKKNNIKWGVITNKPEKYTKLLLKALSIKPNIIVAGDTLKHNKPHPEQLLYAIKMLKTTTNQCLFVGDDYNDILAAKNAVINSVAVSYGYNTPKSNWQPNHIIHEPKQLLEVIDFYKD